MNVSSKLQGIKYLSINLFFMMIASVNVSDPALGSNEYLQTVMKSNNPTSVLKKSQLVPYRLFLPHSTDILVSNILYKADNAEGLRVQPSALDHLKNHNPHKIYLSSENQNAKLQSFITKYNALLSAKIPAEFPFKLKLYKRKDFQENRFISHEYDERFITTKEPLRELRAQLIDFKLSLRRMKEQAKNIKEENEIMKTIQEVYNKSVGGEASSISWWSWISSPLWLFQSSSTPNLNINRIESSLPYEVKQSLFKNHADRVLIASKKRVSTETRDKFRKQWKFSEESGEILPLDSNRNFVNELKAIFLSMPIDAQEKSGKAQAIFSFYHEEREEEKEEERKISEIEI
jgi:hypothetical protein